MNILIVGALNQLFRRGSYTEINFSRKLVVSGKTLLFMICPFCPPFFVCLNNGF